MPKQLEINTYEAHILQVVISEGLESREGWPDDDPHKNRLITIQQKIRLLYPEA